MHEGKFEISVDPRYGEITAVDIRSALEIAGWINPTVTHIDSAVQSADDQPLNIGDTIWVASDIQGHPPTRHEIARLDGVKIFYASPDGCTIGCHKRAAFKSLAAALRDALYKLEREEATPTASSSETPSAASP